MLLYWSVDQYNSVYKGVVVKGCRQERTNITSLESHIFHILLNGMLLGQGVFLFFAAFIVPPLDYMAEWVGFIFG